MAPARDFDAFVNNIVGGDDEKPTSGSKRGGGSRDFDAFAKAIGFQPEPPKPKGGGDSVIDKLFGAPRKLLSETGNTVLKGLEWADLARSAVVAGSIELGDALRTVAGKDDLRSDQFASSGLSWDDFWENTFDHVGIGDVVEDVAPDANPWLKRALGFTGDVALDPLTYTGVGAVSKPAAGARAGRRLLTGKDTARRLINVSDDDLARVGRTREQAYELATDVRRGNSGALGRDAALADAIGANVGLSFGRRVIPGTQRVVARGSELSARAKQPLRNLADKIPDETWAKWERVPGIRAFRNSGPKRLADGTEVSGDVAALMAIDSHRAAQRARVTFMGKHGHELSQIIGDVADEDLSAIRFAIDEGNVAGLSTRRREVAERVQGWLEGVRTDFNKYTGLDLPRLDDYFPREASEALREHLQAKGKRAFTRSDNLKKRLLTPGGTFLGETLETGTVREIQEIADKVLPEGMALPVFLDDPTALLGGYLYKLSGQLRHGALLEGLRRQGLAEYIDTGALSAKVKRAKGDRKFNRAVDNVVASAGRQKATVESDIDELVGDGVQLAADKDAVVDDVLGLHELMDDLDASNQQITEAIRATEGYLAGLDEADAVAAQAVEARAAREALQVEVDEAAANLGLVREKVETLSKKASEGDGAALAELQRGVVETQERLVAARAELVEVNKRQAPKSKSGKAAAKAEAEHRAAEIKYLEDLRVELEIEYQKAAAKHRKYGQQVKDLGRGRGRQSVFDVGDETDPLGQRWELDDEVRFRSRANVRNVLDDSGVSDADYSRMLREQESQVREDLTATPDVGAVESEAQRLAGENARKVAVGDAWEQRLVQAQDAALDLPAEMYDRLSRQLSEWEQLARNRSLAGGPVEAEADRVLSVLEQRSGLENPVAQVPEVVPGHVVDDAAVDLTAQAMAEQMRSVALHYKQEAKKGLDQIDKHIARLADGSEPVGTVIRKSASEGVEVDPSVVMAAEQRIVEAEQLVAKAKAAQAEGVKTSKSVQRAQAELVKATKARDVAAKKLARVTAKLDAAKRVEADTWADLNAIETVDRATVDELQAALSEKIAAARADVERLGERQGYQAQAILDLNDEIESKIMLAREFEAAGDDVEAQILKFEALADAAHTELRDAEWAYRVPEDLTADEARQWWAVRDKRTQGQALDRMSPQDRVMFAENAGQLSELLSTKLAKFADSHKLWGEPETVKLVDNIYNFDKEQVGRLLKIHDQVLSRWKAYALLSPGYHSRNFQTAVFMNGLAGMDSKHYFTMSRYWPAISKAHKQGSPEALEAAFSKIKDPRLQEAFRQLHEHRFVLFGEKGLNQEITQEIMQARGGAGSRPGVLGRGGGRRFLNREAVDPTNLNNLAVRGNFKVAGKTEKLARGPLFIDSLMRGETVEDALERVATHHFDYSDLAHYEKKYMKRIVPFYTWTRKNFPVMVGYLAKKPGGFMWYLHAKRNLEAGVPEDEVVPGYFEEAGAIRLPGNMPLLGGGDGPTRYLAPDLPFLNLSDQFDTGTTGGQVTPFLKLPYEVNANKRVFNDIPFTNRMAVAPESWNWLMPLLGAVSGEFGMPTVQKVDGKWLLTDRDAYKIEQMLPLLGRSRRLLPSEDSYQDRVFTSRLSVMFGVGAFTNTERAQAGELYGRQQALNAALRRDKEIQEALEAEGQ